MSHHQYPEVEGGGSLILAWQVKNKKVLVIGGGEVRPGTSSNFIVQSPGESKELTLTVKAFR